MDGHQERRAPEAPATCATSSSRWMGTSSASRTSPISPLAWWSSTPRRTGWRICGPSSLNYFKPSMRCGPAMSGTSASLRSAAANQARRHSDARMLPRALCPRASGYTGTHSVTDKSPCGPLPGELIVLKENPARYLVEDAERAVKAACRAQDRRRRHGSVLERSAVFLRSAGRLSNFVYAWSEVEGHETSGRSTLRRSPRASMR